MDDDRSFPRGRTTSNQDGSLATPDTYLFTCGRDLYSIEWPRLTPVIERVFIRLVVDVDAFRAHLTRLNEDGNLFISSHKNDHGDFPSIVVNSGPDNGDFTRSLSLIRVIADPLALTAIAVTVRRIKPAFWEREFAVPRVPFVAGDRDDRAAARLYELTKLFVF